jgi:uncharacterized protein (DUF4415 family)
MSNDRPRRPSDPWKAAEAAFGPKDAKAPPSSAKPSAIPGAKETVSLRIDQDVLEHYQSDGPGWQDRINAALREASGIGRDQGLRPEDLNAENDG